MNSLENITKTSVLYTTSKLGQPNCKIIIKYADGSEFFRIIRVNDIVTIAYIQPTDTYNNTISIDHQELATDVCELKQVTGRVERISISSNSYSKQFCSIKLNTSSQYNDDSVEIPVYHIRGLEIVERYVDPDTDIIVPDPVNIYTVNKNNIIYIESLNKYYVLEKNDEGIDELKEYDIAKIPEEQKVNYINAPQVVDLSQFESPEETDPEEPPVITPIENPDKPTGDDKEDNKDSSTEEIDNKEDNKDTSTEENNTSEEDSNNNPTEDTPQV